ncbi:hypothetical protein NLJ89_g4910 [Agrocybe chaxingu]|uniref:Uncharacterized protein n=1 Tax=Agrocybe chaxingu TaxID=84603 RepID=A0A9W8K847_9AGAR|nr:hypothetical protein NLJ89_g4910 [Agrocybe chaxingu]
MSPLQVAPGAINSSFSSLLFLRLFLVLVLVVVSLKLSSFSCSSLNRRLAILGLLLVCFGHGGCSCVFVKASWFWLIAGKRQVLNNAEAGWRRGPAEQGAAEKRRPRKSRMTDVAMKQDSEERRFLSCEAISEKWEPPPPVDTVEQALERAHDFPFSNRPTQPDSAPSSSKHSANTPSIHTTHIPSDETTTPVVSPLPMRAAYAPPFMRSESPSPPSSASMSPDYYDSPPSPPRSLEDQVHVAYALDDIHLAKILLLRLKGIEVTSDDDPRIAAVQDEDFDFCFVPNGRLMDDRDEMMVKEMQAREVERIEECRRLERLRTCERKWEEEKRRMREERAWKKEDRVEGGGEEAAEEEAEAEPMDEDVVLSEEAVVATAAGDEPEPVASTTSRPPPFSTSPSAQALPPTKFNLAKALPEVRGHTSYLTFACLVPVPAHVQPQPPEAPAVPGDTPV